MTHRLATALIAACMAASLSGAPSSTATANGAGFFDDEDREVRGTIYFGSIKDEKGKSLEGATVRITVKDSGEFVYNTSAFGRYKTDFVGLEVNPTLVDVSVTMAGYVVDKKDRRTRSLKPGVPVEINFVLKSTGAKAAGG